MNRYSNKRHRGPTHRGFKMKEYGMEGRIPVALGVADPVTEAGYTVYTKIRAFYLHPTKGWRSTGPEGRR